LFSAAAPVAPAVIHDRRREEPGVAAVEGAGLEGKLIEPRPALREAEHLLADARAEIARHADARAAISHRVIEPVALADMHQLVEGIGDETVPGMADPGAGELREYPSHRGMQTRAADPRVGLVARDPAAEQDPRAVRRGAIVINDLARIADDPAARHQPRHRRARDRLGRDDVAADRDDAAPQPGRQATGV